MVKYMYKKMTIISLLCLFVDQTTKYIITTKMNLFDSINIINSFFKITYVRNYGAAWSILEGNKIFLILVACSALFFIYWFFIRNVKLNRSEIIIYGILVGGIFGNLMDRIMLGYVVDFLDFNVLGYNFPIFNVADICIVISISLIIIDILRKEGKSCKDI